jgi:hypothetical protein
MHFHEMAHNCKPEPEPSVGARERAVGLAKTVEDEG